MMMSEDKHNLNYIKKKLQSYQLSTVTSGLNGDDRYEELKYRLESYEKQLEQLELLNKNGSQRSSSGSNSSSCVDDVSNVGGSSFQVPSLNSLSIGEVRARLAVLGENTNTPGLTGEERRNALVKRLIDAAYSKTDDSVLEVLISANNNNNSTGTSSSKIYNDYNDGTKRDDISLINNVLVDYNHSEVMNSQTTTSISSLPSAHSSLASVVSSSSSSPPPTTTTIATTKVDIHSLKKELKRISNQRALLIASRLSGINQDVDLKLCELRLVKVDHELNTWRNNAAAASKTQRGDKKIVDLKKFKSDFVKLSHYKYKNHGDRGDNYNNDHDDKHGHDVDQVLLVEDLILELEEHKKGVKEEIRAHRSRIKSEVEQHAEFGVDQEQAITKLLKEINLQKPALIGGTNVQKPSNVTEVNLQRPFIMDGASVQRPSVVSGIDVQRPSSLVGRTKLKIQEIISFAQDAANNDIDGNDGDRDFNDGKDKKNDDMNINATSISSIVTNTTALRKVYDLSTPGLMLRSSFLGGTIDLNLKDNIKSNVDTTPTDTKPIAVATSSSVSMYTEEKYSRHHHYEHDDDRYDDNDDDDNDESDSDDDRYDRKSHYTKDRINPLNADKGEDNRGTKIDSDDHDRAVNTYVFYSSNSSSSSSVVSRQPPAMKIASSTMNNTKNSGMITDDDNNNDDHDYDENNYYVDDNHNYNHDNNDDDDVNDTTTNDGEKEKYPIDVVENEKYPIEAKGKNKNDDNDDNSSGINNRHGKNDNDDIDDDKVDVYGDDDDDDYSNDHKADKEFKDFYSDEDRNDYVDHDDSDNNVNNNHDNNNDHNHDDNEDHIDRNHDHNEDHVDIDNDDVNFEHKQIKLLLHQAKQLSSSSCIDEADSLYQQALELDPMNISTLVSYASFLHKRKGELARAEAFYNRCLQVYLPGVVLKKAEEMHALIIRDDLIVEIHNDKVDDSESQLSLGEGVRDDDDVKHHHGGDDDVKHHHGDDDVKHHHGDDGDANHNHRDYHPTECTVTIFNDNPSTIANSIHTLVPLNKRRDNQHHHYGISTKSDSSSSSSPIEMKKRFKLRHVINFLLSYANFMNKSKGDIESSILLYQKGIELSPSDGHFLATYAHFLTSIGQSIYNQRANVYFQEALKLLPGNPQYALWYAKLLKKMGQLNKAELMYRVSLEQSKMMNDIEPIAICNYATFLFKVRKDVIQAKTLFEVGLSIYPNHRGLKKNYRCLVK